MVYADNTFLPLRRRVAKILRPDLLLIRARKPCTLLLLRLFGWKVLFMYDTSSEGKKYIFCKTFLPIIKKVPKVCQPFILYFGK